MIFGSIPVTEATGAILAHSLALPGGVLKKGRTLNDQDIDLLRMAGVTHVIAARAGPSDVAEDLAAGRVAGALAGVHVRVAEAFTGRANLYATAPGLARFDSTAMAELNGADEGVTVATVMPFERVAGGQMLATVKIIPFFVAAEAVARAELLAGRAVLSLAPFKAKRVGLVLTTLPGTKTNVLAKRATVMAQRVVSLGSSLADVRTVAHTETAVAEALLTLHAQGCTPLLVFSASAIVDRADIVPGGLIAAGGSITRLGMPVDPGNLLLFGALNAVPVIGIPSCAASPKLNGFDWVLQRVLADVPITTADIAAMGVGGLLKEIPTRPQPRAGATPTPEPGRQAPRIACLVLAAGRSTRMGSNKLLEPLNGKSLVRHVVDAALASSVARVHVVTGYAADQVVTALAGLDVVITHNPDFAKGLSASLKAGLAALPPEIDGALVLLADMPEVRGKHIDQLLAAFAPADNRCIVVPTRVGKRGNPVLWSRAFFADMAAVSGDTGAKHLLGQYADQVTEVELATDAILTDIDTPDALAALRQRHS
jgi:molybdenum cofactor cytidylyltransferase